MQQLLPMGKPTPFLTITQPLCVLRASACDLLSPNYPLCIVQPTSPCFSRTPVF
ncbi:MAG: hypothetical protein K2M04_04720 [Muribaculaceae bacterium]|nr:hypothetical protein [Muribaculaceae bacterium]